MSEQTYDPLQAIRDELSKTRRQLLPTWIKVFLWIFLVTGGLAGLGFIGGLFGAWYEISLYGLETTNPLSPIGLFLTVLFLLKSLTAFALWTEKDWAIDAAFLDAIVGILVCSGMMFVFPFFGEGFNISIRLELPVLILFLYKMNKIKDDWKVARETSK